MLPLLLIWALLIPLGLFLGLRSNITPIQIKEDSKEENDNKNNNNNGTFKKNKEQYMKDHDKEVL